MSDADPIRELGRHVREGVNDELRAEAEEGERLAATAARRNASLADVAREALFRGDRVMVRYHEHSVTGEVLHAFGDLATLEGPGGRVHCNLGGAVALSVIERDVSAGRTPDPGVESFRARLFELELAETTVEVHAGPLEGVVRGRIVAVASDHLLVETEGGALHIALAAIHSVAER